MCSPIRVGVVASGRPRRCWTSTSAGADRDDDKLVEYGDYIGNGAMFKRLGYLLERTHPLAGALVDACRDRRSRGINDLDPSVNASGPILSAWGIRLNVDLSQANSKSE